MSDKHDLDAQDFRTRAYHGIPENEVLKTMSFAEKCSLLSSCDKDSVKFLVVDREIKKHLARDQAEINLRNVILGTFIGGIFSLAGVVLGYCLKDTQSSKQISPSSAMHQVENGNLAVILPHGKVPPGAPPIAPPTNNPAQVQDNAQPSKHDP